MLKYEIAQEITATNCAALVEFPNKEDSELHKLFSCEELAVLCHNMDVTGEKFALIFCYTGMPPTELAQIKIADVHLSGKYMCGGVKTKAGKNRLIPIVEKILPLIEGFYKSANKYLLTFEGEPVRNRANLRLKIWDNSPLLKKHLPHDVRHICVTLMDDAEVLLKIKQLILKHSSQDIISLVYTHKTVEQLIEAINRI